METCPGEGVMKEEKFPNSRKPSHRWVCGEFWNLRGQHNWEGKKKKQTKKPTEYVPNHNSQWRSSPDACIRHQRAGAGQGGDGCMLRVKTWPECPEDNLRELMWVSNPNYGIARDRGKKERENFPVKSSNLRHSLACSQNKGLSKYQRRAAAAAAKSRQLCPILRPHRRKPTRLLCPWDS